MPNVEVPVASREFKQLLSVMKEDLVLPGDSLEAARDKLNAVHGHPIGPDTRVSWTELGGVRCAWVDTAETAGSDRVLFLCHGGAFIAAGGDGYLFYAEMLAKPCDARVLLVDYRLAPAHRFPAALDDCAAAYAGLLAAGQQPDHVAFIGDSCGGGLAIAALLRGKEQGVAMPACAIALGGWFDLEATGEAAMHPKGRDPFASREFVRARGRDYVGPAGDPRDPLASAIHADLTGLPPLYLQVGDVDLTRDDAVRLADRARPRGVDVTVDIHPEMIHGFQGLASAGLPEAVRALEQVGRFIRDRMP